MKLQELQEKLKQFEQTLPIQFEYVDDNYGISCDCLSTNILQEDNNLILVSTYLDNTAKQIHSVKDLLNTIKKFDKDLNVMVKYHDTELGNMIVQVHHVDKQTQIDEFNYKFDFCILNKVM